MHNLRPIIDRTIICHCRRPPRVYRTKSCWCKLQNIVNGYPAGDTLGLPFVARFVLLVTSFGGFPGAFLLVVVLLPLLE